VDINATLLGQMITFAVFVWFTMKYVWPPITKAMHDREKSIADGLAAADKGHRDLELARHKSTEIIQQAKVEAAKIIDQANHRSLRLVEEAKEKARDEGKRLINHANEEITLQANQAKRDLQADVAILAVSIAEKVAQNEFDEKMHQDLLIKVAAEI